MSHGKNDSIKTKKERRSSFWNKQRHIVWSAKSDQMQCIVTKKRLFFPAELSTPQLSPDLKAPTKHFTQKNTVYNKVTFINHLRRAHSLDKLEQNHLFHRLLHPSHIGYWSIAYMPLCKGLKSSPSVFVNPGGEGHLR